MKVSLAECFYNQRIPFLSSSFEFHNCLDKDMPIVTFKMVEFAIKLPKLILKVNIKWYKDSYDLSLITPTRKRWYDNLFH